MSKSSYELQRDETIAQNRAKLVELGLEKVHTSEPQSIRPSALKKAPRLPRTEGERRSSKRLQAERALEPLPLPEETVPVAREPKRPCRKRAPLAPAEFLLIDNVRRFMEENVPDDHTLEERRMFGMLMWLVRGNMFLGVGHDSGLLLVRVGESNVASILAANPAGVRRCQSANSSRVFPGTLMVEPDQYRGEARMRTWFEHAMRHNATMQSKHPSDKPQKKDGAALSASSRKDSPSAAASSAASEPRVPLLAVQEAVIPAAPQRRPASTHSGLLQTAELCSAFAAEPTRLKGSGC